jgi:hypothetical protein
MNLYKFNIKEGYKKYKHHNYVYIFVDQIGVEPIYQLVQAAHVAMVVGQKMNKTFDAHKIYFQICAVPKDILPEIFARNLEKQGFTVEAFYEDDVERVIAVATHPIRSPSKKKNILKQYPLLTF